MGVSARRRSARPPLPAPTDSMDEGGTSGIDTDVATNVTTRTDRSSYELPADGSPITIPTHDIVSKTEGGNGGQVRAKSHTSTSLLIEYFEGSSTGDRAKSKPTVRVKVSQNPKKRSASGAHDAVQISGIGEDRKPSYTRRISLGSSRKADIALTNTESAGARSAGSNSSSGPPVEIEVLDHIGSELSSVSRGLAYNPVESNVSSMPPDSMLEGYEGQRGERSRSLDDDDDGVTVKGGDYLREPDKSRDRSRSTERIAQKVMERLNRHTSTPLKSGKSRSERSLGKQYDVEGSDVSNNPRLLGLVQDTIKNVILPEIQAAKQDQRYIRDTRSGEHNRGSSIRGDGLVRRVSKSSSTPNITSKPRVVLNRDGDDPGTTLSRGDSERKMRKSSGGSYRDDREKTSRSTTSLRDAGAASLGAGILTAANLEKHDSRSEGYERRRKRRSKSGGSRSRSTGATETGEGVYTSREGIPPLPLVGPIDDSELTRDSLISDKEQSRASAETRTPVREVSRGSLQRQVNSPPISSRTPTRTPMARNLGTSRDTRSSQSPKSAEAKKPTTGKEEELAIAGITGAALAAGTEELYRHHVDADGYGDSSPKMRKVSSPVQSVSSLRKNFEDETFASKESQPHSAASRSSAGRLRDKRASQTSLPSGTSSPLARSAQRSPNALAGAHELARSPGTPIDGENMDEFYERQHRINDEYRQSYISSDSPKGDSFRATNRDSYQTNPYPQDEKRWTMFTDDSPVGLTTGPPGEKDLQNVDAGHAKYVHALPGAESAVASLMEPSSISSGSPTKASYTDRMSAHLREMSKDSPPMYQGSTLSQTMPSRDRWSAIKQHAQSTSGSTPRLGPRSIDSPRQSPARSPERDTAAFVGASGIADSPSPDMRHYDDLESVDSSNRSIVKGPLGGDVTGKDTWPYTPERASPAGMSASSKDSRSLGGGASKEDAVFAAAAAGATAIAGAYTLHKAVTEGDAADRQLPRDLRDSKSSSPALSRDRNYVAESPSRSAGSLTPEADQKQYSKADVEEFNRAMDAQAVDERDDPFAVDVKKARHISGNSHGMTSPIYDSSTGKGKDRIQSKDIVALMDHLTVRDAQRNARDTEIIVTLVRSAAEMRESFDKMKQFILEQDRMIMANTDRSADSAAQKVLGGPRPLPAQSSGYIGTQSQEDIQSKRKGVLRRALRGLTGGKSSNDLAKVEGMLMQILENVEDLKHQGGNSGAPGDQRDLSASHTDDSLDEYERLRNATGDAYDVQSSSSTSSTPREGAPHLGFVPRAEKQQFHSGYDGRRGSMNRVSTVWEGDEDDELDENDPYLAHIPVEGGERLTTPTQEAYRNRQTTPQATPQQRPAGSDGMADDRTPRSIDRQRKHQSNNSSTFGGAKVSRWSKTTSSSVAPDQAYLDSPRDILRKAKIQSDASRSGSTIARYEDEDYELQDDDRLRSTQSLVREQPQDGSEGRSIGSQASKINRTPSPLIPSETSSARQHHAYEYARGTSPVQEDLDPEFDDPKYQAVRNSLLLQHPQPRQGPTGRHQNTLESQAHDFDDPTGTNSDLSQKTVSDFDPAMWGSSGTTGLAKHRLSQVEPLSPISMGSPAARAVPRSVPAHQASLVPQQQQTAPPIPPKIRHDEPDYDADWEPQFSNSGFSRGGYYSSPFGSGHLLEPIEEVRYSLETDSGHMSPEPEIASAQAVNMRSSARKITGPRPMGARNMSAEQPRLVETSGTIRRKPLSSY